MKMQIYVHTCMNDHKSGFRKRCVHAMPPCIFFQTVRLPTRHKKWTLTIRWKISENTLTNIFVLASRKWIEHNIKGIHSPNNENCHLLILMSLKPCMTFVCTRHFLKVNGAHFHCMHKKILRRIPKYFCSTENDLTVLELSKWEF